MKPRWHNVKMKRDDFTKSAFVWARPIDRPGFILLFDGQRKEIVSLAECRLMEANKELRWLECLPLKAHNSVEDQYRAVKEGPIFPAGWDKREARPVQKTLVVSEPSRPIVTLKERRTLVTNSQE